MIPKTQLQAEQTVTKYLLDTIKRTPPEKTVENIIVLEDIWQIKTEHFQQLREAQALYNALLRGKKNVAEINWLTTQGDIETMYPHDADTIIKQLEELDAAIDLTNPQDVADSAEYIVSSWRKETTIHQLTQLASELRSLSPMEDAKIPQKLSNILETQLAGTNSATTTVHIADALYDEVERLEQIANGKVILNGLMTEFWELDNITNGLKPGQLIVVAARPGMGKSALAFQIAKVAASGGIPAAYYSYEMTSSELSVRLLSMETSISGGQIQRGSIDRQELQTLATKALSISSYPLYIDESSDKSVEDISLSAMILNGKLANDNKKLGLIVIDYIQLVKISAGKSRNEGIGDVSIKLKSLAHTLGCPIIAVSQLNRSVESRPDKHPMMSDLRDSGQVEQDANLILMLYRDDYYNEDSDDKGLVEIQVAKNRSGPTGKFNLQFIPENTNFKNDVGAIRPKFRKKIKGETL